MISEITFANHYKEFWRDLMPGIDDYLRLINSGLKERIDPPIDIEDIAERRILINSIVYDIFEKIILDKEINLRDFLETEAFLKKINELKKIFSSNLKRFDRYDIFKDEFVTNEIDILKTLIFNLYHQYRWRNNIVIKPRFYGCGILFETHGDLMYNSTLVELKAGRRYCKKNDLIQLFIYGALNSIASHPYDIKLFEIYNPRMGICWSENCDDIAQVISGCPSGDLFSEIILYISESYRSI